MIDLDHNAGSPLRPEVGAAMVELLGRAHALGNPSSIHGLGRAAREVVERARRRVGAAVGAEPLEVTFTAGGTEADNLAVLGIARALRAAGRPAGLLTSPLEHPAVARAAAHLEREGHRVCRVDVDAAGRIDAAEVAQRLVDDPELGLVSLAAANHELGNVYDIAAIVAAARAVREDVIVHTDAVQAFGKIPIALGDWGVDALSLSAHKIGGPAGIGALVHRKHLRFAPLMFGGHQERGNRVGTEAVVLAEGFGVAARLAAAEVDRFAAVRTLRQALLDGLAPLGARIHGDPTANTGNTVNAGFEGCPGELVCMSLDLEGFAVSTGAACSAGTLEPSPVLLALGLDPRRAAEAIRISLGPRNTAADVEGLLAVLPVILDRVRGAVAGGGP